VRDRLNPEDEDDTLEGLCAEPAMLGVLAAESDGEGGAESVAPGWIVITRTSVAATVASAAISRASDPSRGVVVNTQKNGSAPERGNAAGFGSVA
jgi:hypothetical protein